MLFREQEDVKKVELWTNPVLITIANILVIILTFFISGVGKPGVLCYVLGTIFALIIYLVYTKKPNITLRNIWFVCRFSI